jgi:hypothetical protein
MTVRGTLEDVTHRRGRRHFELMAVIVPFPEIESTKQNKRGRGDGTKRRMERGSTRGVCWKNLRNKSDGWIGKERREGRKEGEGRGKEERD